MNPTRVTNSTWNQTSILSIENVQKIDHGIYSCQIMSQNSYHQKFFELKIEGIRILLEKEIANFFIEGKPNRPIIVEAEQLVNGLVRIVWFIDDVGNSGLIDAYLEWGAGSFEKKSSIKSVDCKFVLITKYFLFS